MEALVWQIIVVTLAATISGVSKAIMDTISFHFSISIFSGKSRWWDPTKSHRNKYEWFPNSKVLTWLFSNHLVFVTDAWHFFQMLKDITFAIAFGLAGIFLPWWSLFIIYIFQRTIFHVLYTYLFKKSTYKI